MSKADCSIVRDLMPLCIDGAASEESQRLVEQHTAACSECAEVYSEMRRELPNVEPRPEVAAMEHAAKNLRFRRTIRAMWAIILGMAALVIALVANAAGVARFVDDMWYQLRYVGSEGELRLEALNVALEWQPYSRVRLTMESSPTDNRPFRPEMQLRYDELTGEAYLQIRVYAAEEMERDVLYINDIPFYADNFSHEYEHMRYDGDVLYYEYPLNPEANSWTKVAITRIELVSGGDVLLLWQNGDGLPAYCRAGSIERGTEPIPTATPEPTRPGGVYRSTPTATPVPTATPKPALPPHKR